MCPNKEKCHLSVKDGKPFCNIHNKFLEIADDWENVDWERIPMNHILYVAYLNGKEGEILIDEEI